jgi:putative methyltransferase (TIGR04325 family)
MRKLRTFAKSIVPYGIVNEVRQRRDRPKQLWQGIYPDFASVPVFGAAFASSNWLEPEAESTGRFRRQALDEHRMQKDAPSRYVLLPSVAAALTQLDKPLRILDFGGACGIAHVYFAPRMLPDAKYEYRVVDNKGSCEAGRAIYHDDPRVSFHETLDEVPGADLVFMSGVLQYISDYRALLQRLAEFKPRAFVLTFTPVGPNPTFAAAQVNLPNSAFPHWFFNETEFVQWFRELGYTATFRSPVEQPFDTTNYPASHQLLQLSNWVFINNN